MALRTWLKSLGAAFAGAAVVGAVQLGAGYGLELVRLPRDFTGPAVDRWPAQLTWLAWFAAVATAVGAYAGQRIAAGHPARHRAGAGRTRAYGLARSMVFALVAAAGAAIAVVGLSALPARAAVGPEQPVLAVALTGGVGAAVGVLAAVAASAHPVLRWNLLLVTGALWLLAIGSVAPVLRAGDPVAEIRLGVFDPAGLDPTGAGTRALVLLPALALAIAVAVSGWFRWRHQPVFAGAVAGMLGPAVVNAAYLIAGAGQGGRYQDDPYWAALLAVAAGALGSIVTTGVRRPRSAARTAPPSTSAPAPESAAPAPVPASAAPVAAPAPGPSPAVPAKAVPAKAVPPPVVAPVVAAGPEPGVAPAAARQHPGNRPAPAPVAVTPRVTPSPVAAASGPAPAPVPATTARPVPRPVAPPPVATTPVAPPPVAPAPVTPASVTPAPAADPGVGVGPTRTSRIPRPRFGRARRPPPPALTDEEAEHVDWVSELRRPSRRPDGRSRSGGADDQASGR
ncbi:hypothetical protein O7623_16890 [Solwaraspora sp. WMMD791]|uniref:hypothetical protein n=1 Tax=Solwaraspora sp. WMMD791 TaxID=3016086 RepID=UPI00249C5421|nr:hypothetical protein [Solwaraspora sp. WMMD791]WFE25092.1 hypothetical protein O7623_16890 [Solwaraspora sp. WMMD791]